MQHLSHYFDMPHTLAVESGLRINLLIAWHILHNHKLCCIEMLCNHAGCSHTPGHIQNVTAFRSAFQIVLAQSLTMCVCRELMFPLSPPSLLAWLTLMTSAF